MMSEFAIVTTMLAAVIAAASVLIRSFGPRYGLWLASLSTIPLREALSFDIVGTVTVYPADFLIGLLAIDLLYSRGYREAWASSLYFKLGLALFVLGLPGLYTASRLFWGVTSLYRDVLQLLVFFVTFLLVRNATDARRALLALLLGLVPAVVYGIYQSTLPVDAALPDWANRMIAWDSQGQKDIRIFSTFSHPLRFSHYLSVGLALAVGLVPGSRRATRLVLVLAAAGIVYCNLQTYSIGGVLGTIAGIGAIAFVYRRGLAIALAPVALVALLLVAPGALTSKAQRVLTGQATTVAARVVTYQQAVTVLRDKPVLGLGWGGIRDALENEYRLTRANAVAFGAENYFLQYGMALGFPGIGIAVTILVVFLARMNGIRTGWPKYAIVGGAAAWYVQAQFFPSVSITDTSLLWALLAVSERATSRDNGDIQESGDESEGVGDDIRNGGREGHA